MQSIRRGSTIGHLNVHPFDWETRFDIRSHCIAPIIWSGVRAVVPFELCVSADSNGSQDIADSVLRSADSLECYRSTSMATLPSPFSNISCNDSEDSILRFGDAQRAEASQLFSLVEEQDLPSRHDEKEPGHHNRSPASSSPQSTRYKATTECSPTAKTRPASSLDRWSPIRNSSRHVVAYSEGVECRSPSTVSAFSPPKRLSFPGSSLPRRPSTSALPGRTAPLALSLRRPVSPREDTLYMGLALCSPTQEVLVMLAPIRLSVLRVCPPSSQPHVRAARTAPPPFPSGGGERRREGGRRLLPC